MGIGIFVFFVVFSVEILVREFWKKYGWSVFFRLIVDFFLFVFL